MHDTLAKYSEDNLQFLSRELVMNYIFASKTKSNELERHIESAIDKGIKGGGTVVGKNYFNYRSPEDFKYEVKSRTYKNLIDVNHQGGRKDSNTPSRVILVIGAGASFNTFKSIPLANSAIDGIHESFKLVKETTFADVVELALEFGNDQGERALKYLYKKHYNKLIPSNKIKYWSDIFAVVLALAKKYNEELGKLRLYSFVQKSPKSPTSPDFETSLVLLGKFFPNSDIREQIGRLYNYRHGPVFSYEVIAHLLKHRFIDVVINFNFDELLDHSIRDEMHGDEYIKIISDGDCRPISDLLIDNRLKQAIYIKPHGTVSHKSSMRFTKDHYYELPEDMKNLLSDLIGCKPSSAVSHRVNLISLGFGMESLEFNEILARNLPLGSNIFDIFYANLKSIEDSKREIEKTRNNYKRIFQNAKRSVNSNEIGHNLFLISSESVLGFASSYKDSNLPMPSHGRIFNILFETIEAHFTNMSPQKLSSHWLKFAVFGNSKIWAGFLGERGKNLNGPIDYPKEYFEGPDYLLDRVKFEIILAAFTRNGVVSPRSLLKENSGYYYQLYFNHYDKKDQKNKIVPFVQIITELNFIDISIKHSDKLYFNDSFSEYSKFDIKEFTSFFSDKLRMNLGNRAIKKKIRYAVNDLIHTSQRIISTRYTARGFFAYDEYEKKELLHTYLGFHAQVFSQLNEGDWTAAMIVLEDLEFLKLYLPKEKVGKVYAIVCDTHLDITETGDPIQLSKNADERYNNYKIKVRQTKSIVKKFPNVKFEILFLPIFWHEHNMLLFGKLNRRAKSMEEVRATYFYNKMTSSTIDPVGMTVTSNLSLLSGTYQNYISKAMYYCGINEKCSEYSHWSNLEASLK